MSELEESRRQFIAALNELPDNLFAGGQVARTLAAALTNGEKGHAADIRSWRQHQGT
jgi:hypothetical protein